VTYLPSLYAARWNQAAILVADIKNFTPLTQIVRVIRTSQQEKQDTGVLRRILNEHCREMASIIQEDGRGRIDRFFGAGVMAIFGEHEVNPVKATTTAVYVAAKLVQRFRTLKNRFLEQAFGVGYDTDYSESVNIDLSVGIDFGTVLFDYLGDENHREYTVIGDHVNFAKRLEYEALRVDEAGHLRQPILISPTVERCIRPWIHQCATCVVRGREMDYACTAHGLFPQDLDEAKFMYSWETNDWTGSWESTGWSPPSAVFES
jgi:class 3 adenylate cyclase